MSNVFKSRGPELFDNGYEVVPITRIDATDSKGNYCLARVKPRR
ncbi:hypothetical protein [Proteus phage P16-2532]|nr:hypothetical protein [Proteus phage P16-2532]